MNAKPLVLACDDDSSVLKTLQISLKGQFDVHTASTVVQAKALITKFEYDAAIIDLNYEGQEYDGIDLLDHFSKKSPATFLVVLSGDTNVQRAVEAMRRKLFEFVHKRENFFDSLKIVLDRVIQIKEAKMARFGTTFLTKSRLVLEIIRTAESIVNANTDAAILINGETGTGKEFLAQHVARLRNMRLVSANMSCVPKDTAESILFGHERGAFTGANANKMGLIESANGGMFFMDEIGECSSDVQSKLLRTLDQKEIQPVGANRTRKVNVCFMAATHCDLNEMVKQGAFRQDLLQRLNTFVLKMPALRDRPEDILLYINSFLSDGGNESTHYSLTTEAIQALLMYSWPGNVRELSHVAQRIRVLSKKTIIDRADIVYYIGLGGGSIETAHSVSTQSEINSRRNLVLRTLKENNGSKRVSAKSLGISEATLYRWINEFGITASIAAEGVTS